MVPRDDGREGYVALVDPGKCVSCGICAGSCAPMGVGPPERTGRDQLQEVKDFIASAAPSAEEVVVVGCVNSAAGWSSGALADVPIFGVSCVGALHTSVIEYLVRAGAGGVLVATCPSRDCWNREGVMWLEERVYHAREAELQDRVDRRRVRIVSAAQYETAHLAREVEAFAAHVGSLEEAAGEAAIEIDAVCETPEVSVAEAVEG